MRPTKRNSGSTKRTFRGKHRFEHWLRDNQVYFITARVRGKFPAFNTEEAKSVFWDAFEHYTVAHGFVPWVTSLLGNHYHTLGYLKLGTELPRMMRGIHGRTAKRVNDLLVAEGLDRIKPFWIDSGRQNYFDGCIRDDLQARRAYRYTLIQSERHGVCDDWRTYDHTRVGLDIDRAVKRALELGAFMEGVRYKRYEGRHAD
ncbi:hypothetical protein [Algisphaera agarilytica]|uniref:Transposase IS200-like domain-containing protein n=1 Tax=Algisphaera agarilytica TaxID=1385975 RepID=A0A7X0LJ29_9BACT|nr:hypothetical protein [Algisphaera agarilytica]MBB6428865.1 hypothetical protein [Algisphaera agarilytica]